MALFLSRCAAIIGVLLVFAGCGEDRRSEPSPPPEPRKTTSFGAVELDQIQEFLDMLKSGRQDVPKPASEGDARQALFYEYFVASVGEFQESSRRGLPWAAGSPDLKLKGVVLRIRNETFERDGAIKIIHEFVRHKGVGFAPLEVGKEYGVFQLLPASGPSDPEYHGIFDVASLRAISLWEEGA